ncbi:hypothetical protein PQX77_002956 [Marasmius sp. AFHP31]|nr:hypothetical protein PQX77_002956 [Marasmius sp. AFHP31]
MVAVGFSSRLVNIWDLKELRRKSARVSLELRRDLVCIEWIRNDCLVVGQQEGQVAVMDIGESESTLTNLEGQPVGTVSSLALLGEGRVLAVGIGDKVHLWQVGASILEGNNYVWRTIGHLPDPPDTYRLSATDCAVTALFASNESTLFVSYADNLVISWSIIATNPVNAVDMTGIQIAGRITDICPETCQFLVANTMRGTYLLHDCGPSVGTREYRPSRIATSRVLVAKFLAPDVFVGSADNQLIMWNTRGSRIQTMGRDTLATDIQTFDTAYDQRQDVGHIAIALSDGTSTSLRLWHTVIAEDRRRGCCLPIVDILNAAPQWVWAGVALLFMTLIPWNKVFVIKEFVRRL